MLPTTPTHLAAQHGNVNVLQNIIIKNPNCINAVDRDGRTPFEVAVSKSRWQQARVLADAGAIVNYSMVFNVLHRTLAESEQCAKLGEVNRANALEESVKTCLSLNLYHPPQLDNILAAALFHQRAGVIRFLLSQNKITPNHVRPNGVSILYYIFLFDDPALGLELVANPLTILDLPLVPPIPPSSPLALAIPLNHRGIYPLHAAVFHANRSISLIYASLLEAVMKRVGNLSPLDVQGRAPLDVATQLREWEVACLIYEQGGDGNIDLPTLDETLAETEDEDECQQIVELRELVQDNELYDAINMRKWELAQSLCRAGAGEEKDIERLESILKVTEDPGEREQIQTLMALLAIAPEEEDVPVGDAELPSIAVEKD